jgi:transcriptional antiterminator RfaH
MALLWYALRSKPRKEDTVWLQLRSQGYEAVYPRLRVQPVNPRARKLVPYFPGYLFVQVDLEETGISVFQWMPHTLGLVGFGGEPAPVPDHLIQAIIKRLEDVNKAGGELLHGLAPGEKVWITDGPFRGYEAIFDAQVPGHERVRVLLEFLGNNRKVAVELRAGQIQRRKRS